MNAVGKIHRDRPLRQIDDVPLRRKDKHLIGKDVQLQGVHEFLRIGCILPFQYAPEPADFRVEILRVRVLALFIAPVRRHAVFGNVVHFPRADLNFHGLPLRVDHRRMERLIHVRLRNGDVILEAVRKRLPQGMGNAQHSVALGHGIHNDPHRIEIIDLGQILIIPLHFLVDAVEMLRTPCNGRLDARLFDMVVKDPHRIVDDFLAGFALLLHLPHQIVVFLGIEVMEAQVFQLPFDIVNAEAVRERRVDFQRLPGDALLFFPPEYAESTHIMQAVRQFDDHHADILRHGEEHLTEVFKLLVFLVLVMELGEFRHAVYQEGHIVAKHHADVFQRIFRIFHHIMKKRGNDPLRVHFKLRQNVRHRQRMDDIGLARGADLLRMGLMRQLERFLDSVELFGIMNVDLHRVHQFLIGLPDLFRVVLLFFLRFDVFFLMQQKFRQRRSRRIGMDGFFIERFAHQRLPLGFALLCRVFILLPDRELPFLFHTDRSLLTSDTGNTSAMSANPFYLSAHDTGNTPARSGCTGTGCRFPQTR